MKCKTSPPHNGKATLYETIHALHRAYAINRPHLISHQTFNICNVHLSFFLVMANRMSSPKKDIGVNWWQQAVRSFITPYGKAKPAPEPANIFKRLQPFTCEWLTRPEYAMSELSDTITSNIPVLQENSENYLDEGLVEKLQSHFQPMLESMKALDNKTTGSPTAKDAKKVLKSLVTDTSLDADMDKVFQLSSALFAISSNYLISTALLRHPKQFSSLVENKRKTAAVFKETSTAEAMKDYILANYQDGDPVSTQSVSKAASETVARAFQDSSSSEEEVAVQATNPSKKRKRQAEQASSTNLTRLPSPPAKRAKKTKKMKNQKK